MSGGPEGLTRAERRERPRRHRISTRIDGMTLERPQAGGRVADPAAKIVNRRGYDSYAATKRRPWDVKNENRKTAKAARAARRKNR